MPGLTPSGRPGLCSSDRPIVGCCDSSPDPCACCNTTDYSFFFSQIFGDCVPPGYPRGQVNYGKMFRVRMNTSFNNSGGGSGTNSTNQPFSFTWSESGSGSATLIFSRGLSAEEHALRAGVDIGEVIAIPGPAQCDRFYSIESSTGSASASSQTTVGDFEGSFSAECDRPEAGLGPLWFGYPVPGQICLAPLIPILTRAAVPTGGTPYEPATGCDAESTGGPDGFGQLPFGISGGETLGEVDPTCGGSETYSATFTSSGGEFSSAYGSSEKLSIRHNRYSGGVRWSFTSSRTDSGTTPQGISNEGSSNGSLSGRISFSMTPMSTCDDLDPGEFDIVDAPDDPDLGDCDCGEIAPEIEFLLAIPCDVASGYRSVSRADWESRPPGKDTLRIANSQTGQVWCYTIAAQINGQIYDLAETDGDIKSWEDIGACGQPECADIPPQEDKVVLFICGDELENPTGALLHTPESTAIAVDRTLVENLFASAPAPPPGQVNVVLANWIRFVRSGQQGPQGLPVPVLFCYSVVDGGLVEAPQGTPGPPPQANIEVVAIDEQILCGELCWVRSPIIIDPPIEPEPDRPVFGQNSVLPPPDEPPSAERLFNLPPGAFL